MKLKYSILWFEDNESWFNTLSMYIKDYLDENGFDFVPYRYINDQNGINNILKKCDYDLILMDYTLDGIKGDAIIEDIRNHEFYTEIVFYSQSGTQVIRDIISAKGVDGIYCTSRDISEFENKVTSIIRNTIKKVQDVNNMRGLVISETIDLETKIEEIMKRFFHLNKGDIFDEKRQKLHTKITEKKVEQYREEFSKIDEISNKTLDILIEEDILSVNNLYNGLHSILNDDIKEINKTLNSKLESNERLFWESKIIELSTLKSELKEFNDEIIKVRNTLAHVQEKIGSDGIPYLESINKNGTTITFNNEKYIEIRKNIKKHSGILDRIEYHCCPIEVENNEVAAAVQDETLPQ